MAGQWFLGGGQLLTGPTITEGPFLRLSQLSPRVSLRYSPQGALLHSPSLRLAAAASPDRPPSLLSNPLFLLARRLSGR
jgi:hypothetical protein